MNFLRPIEARPDPSEYLETNYTTKQRINKFKLTTTTAVTQLIKKSQAKICELDPMPSSLVKDICSCFSTHHHSNYKQIYG